MKSPSKIPTEGKGIKETYNHKGFILTKDEVVTMYTALKILHDYGGDWIEEPQDIEFLEKVGLIIKKIEDIWQKTRLN